MATLVLGTMGSVLSQSVGGAVSKVVGQAASSLLKPHPQEQARIDIGPRLTTLAGIGATEGAPIARVYGRARVGGQMIWATRFYQQTNITMTPVTRSGGGGKSSQPARVTNTSITYSYFASFAIGLCEGPVAFVRRIWADGKELDVTSVTMRFYRGDETQEADPLIAAIEKPGTVPAYRGLAYVVFERMPLAAFGNRIPNLTFEIVRPAEGVGAMIQGVDLIPGASEFGYQPSLHISLPGPGTVVKENRNQSWAATDWQASLDALQALCPNLKSVALVVTWFGDDLAAGNCKITPRIDNRFKTLSYPQIPLYVPDWWVAGLWRAVAPMVSFTGGTPAYGGTPSDSSVVEAIRDLKARGLAVLFYPFIMMDIPPANTLVSPWTGVSPQPPYPWRGRITCAPAPGMAGTVDATPAAADQIAAFMGSASPAPGEWSFRRFILHYASLCKNAGGVDAFLIGSELVALTRIRSAPGTYPAAQALATLASDVKAILGEAKISYAADWTEYGAHVLNGGTEVRFPLDVVWASPAVSFIGIDAYWPLSDWRDGIHLDQAEASSVHDLDYLTARMAAGEAYDWYYQSQSARAAQTRTPITDGSYGKPWVFRQKDLAGFWSSQHYERMGGVELAAPTAWAARSKPIWLTETGCPAVDRGANAPNVFPDPKSSEGGLPYFSRGYRDDLMQMRFIEAVIARFDSSRAGFVESWNPVSPVYAGRMVDCARIHFWAWDARPFPAFPELGALWADAPQWETGHWLNGRLEGLPLDRLLTTLAQSVQTTTITFPRPDVLGYLDGYVLDRAMSMRAAIEPLSDFFGFDPIFSGGMARFTSRAKKAALTLTPDDIVPDRDGIFIHMTRAQESELPHEMAVSFCDSEGDYAAATVLSRRISGWSKRRSETEAALMINRATAQRLADIWLEDIWVARETATFQIRPALCGIEAGDIVSLDAGAGQRDWLVTHIADGPVRVLTTRAIDASIYDRAPVSLPRQLKSPPRSSGPPFALLLDLAIARGKETVTQFVAAYADPWPGALSVVDASRDAFVGLATIEAPSAIGKTLTALKPGPVACFDRGNYLDVQLYSGSLASAGDGLALDGGASMAICGSDGAWEIFAFARAELIASNTYRLTRLLRGLGGEESLSARTTPAGAMVVLLDATLTPVASGLSSVGLVRKLRIGPVDKNPGDDSYITIESSPQNKAFKPYAPVKPKAKRSASGITLSFIRRGRIDGDGWETMEIPLGEEKEIYEIAITLPAGDQRIITTDTPAALYPAAAIAADFPSPPARLSLTLRQISPLTGPGFPLLAQVPVL